MIWLTGRGQFGGHLSDRRGLRGQDTAIEGGQLSGAAGTSMSEIVDTSREGGASTCGTEVVYRIGDQSGVGTGSRVGPGDKPLCRAG